jgi:putative membrane protein
MRITTPLSIAAVIIASIAAVLALPLLLSAQTLDDHTAREEAAGQALWVEMQAQEITCSDLSDEDFAALGEYFMGVMLGDSHEAMNARMTQMMGEEGEEQMHVVLGKRMSGCNPDAESQYGMGGMMPMMMGMGGGFWGGDINPMSSGFNSFNNNSMMGYGFGGFFGGFIMLLFWALVIVGIIALVRYLSNGNLRAGSSKSALDILKERYAKGEIDKDEFEAKSREIKKL